MSRNNIFCNQKRCDGPSLKINEKESIQSQSRQKCYWCYLERECCLLTVLVNYYLGKSTTLSLVVNKPDHGSSLLPNRLWCASFFGKESYIHTFHKDTRHFKRKEPCKSVILWESLSKVNVPLQLPEVNLTKLVWSQAFDFLGFGVWSYIHAVECQKSRVIDPSEA